METILVTGATGYVGGRLAPLLLSKGYKVRVLVRAALKLKSRPWASHENLEIVEGDMHDEAALHQALAGCDVMYYLVHSMKEEGDFAATDRDAAYTAVRALRGLDVKRIIYLSGILPPGDKVSPHLRSRAEVGTILALSGVPVTTLRAAQIIGVGSASFEMIRYLVDRLPIMLTPHWLHVRTQPISMSNVLVYLAGVLEKPETAGQTYDIGGKDIMTYRQLLDAYAEAAGLPRRRMIPVPGMSLWLSSHWVSWVTPIPAPLVRALVEGLRNEVICADERIREIIPQDLLGVKQAVARALGRVRRKDVDTSWLDAGLPAVPEWLAHGDPDYAGGALRSDAYRMVLKARPEEVWRPIVRIGGQNGWYSRNFLWKLRGFMDRLAGGPGTQRGRRDPDNLFIGDGLDFWRVMDVRENERLLLLTEMRLPGEGLMDVTLTPLASDETELRISLYFRPHGVMGLAYWYGVTPFHGMAFKGMLRAIARNLARPVVIEPQRVKAHPLNRQD